MLKQLVGATSLLARLRLATLDRGQPGEDRKAEGIIPDLSVRENLTLVLLPKLAKAGIVSRRAQAEVVDKFMKRLRVKASSPDQKIRGSW